MPQSVLKTLAGSALLSELGFEFQSGSSVGHLPLS
jgi:hypothetical protein